MNWPVDALMMRGWLWLLASFAVSAAATWMALRYARRKKLIDLPDARRSHSIPTPRGGGIGIVITVLLGLAALAHYFPDMGSPSRLMIAIALIAIIGWIDDHRPLPALLRLVVHCVAVAIWLAPLIGAALSSSAQLDTTPLQTTGIVVVLGIICVWSINLHNFMDGINGLLSLQAIFVLLVLAALCLGDGHALHSAQMGLWAAAIFGFLPFNFPRARIFMGDVGSGALGLLIAVAVIWQFSTQASAVPSGLIAVSAFLTDATCTLLWRALSGQPWYRAHREHLYQWMVRAGMSHARVVAWYMGWNVLVVLPVLYYINRHPDNALRWATATVLLYVLAISVWVGARLWCLHKVKVEVVHAHA